MIDQYPNRRAYRAALGILLIETGRADEARQHVETLRLAEVPEDVDWLLTTSLLADVYASLRDTGRSSELYELLLPYEASNIVIGFAASCDGPVSRLLGRLAAVTERPHEAARHFERALAMAERLRAPLLKARIEANRAEATGDA
jgi:hypothetical protein